MSNVEVIVAAMNRKDLSLYFGMNANTDMTIANQAEEYFFLQKEINGNRVRMISTGTRGVGLNRNIGLENSHSPILLLADEDIIYHSGYEKTIEKAFEELTDADVIIFQMQFIKNGQIYDVDTHKTQRIHIWNGLGFGTYQIAIKRDALLKANIHFTHLFGGGCIYSAGEDSLFLIDCFKYGLKVYSYAGLIGDNIRDSSSWFNGFTPKFYFDRGAFAACAFPRIKYLICLYYLIAYRKQKNIGAKQKLKLMLQGCNGYRKLDVYQEKR